MSSKTISFEKAQGIAEDLKQPTYSVLHSFGVTGEIYPEFQSDYHKEISNLLATPHKFSKKDYNRLQQLKRYFEVHKPINP